MSTILSETQSNSCVFFVPLIQFTIKKIIPSNIKIIDSGEAVAKQTKRILEENNILNNSIEIATQTFYTNSDPTVLENILENKEKVFYKNF